MPIADRVLDYLKNKGVHYHVVQHSHTGTSLQTAGSAHIDSHKVAKGVVLKDEQGYLMAVLPADRDVDMHAVEDAVARRMAFAEEPELKDLFKDCEAGAVPAVAGAYGMDSVVDTALRVLPDIYFEAGDHEELIHIRESEFEKLTADAVHAPVSKPIE